MKIYNPTDIGDRNKLMILRLIKVYDGISRQEISKRMHLSAPAVSNNVAALIENGIVYENGYGVKVDYVKAIKETFIM